jgi:hypothetical protein
LAGELAGAYREPRIGGRALPFREQPVESASVGEELEPQQRRCAASVPVACGGNFDGGHAGDAIRSKRR